MERPIQGIRKDLYEKVILMLRPKIQGMGVKDHLKGMKFHQSTEQGEVGVYKDLTGGLVSMSSKKQGTCLPCSLLTLVPNSLTGIQFLKENSYSDMTHLTKRLGSKTKMHNSGFK